MKVTNPQARKCRYEHDAAGRLIRKTRKLLNVQTRTWTYRWNAEDRLISATDPQGETWLYTYGPLARRISKTGPDSPRITFTWDGTRRPLAQTLWDSSRHRTITATSIIHTPGPTHSVLQGCSGTDDDTYDALEQQYGNHVADGVDHNAGVRLNSERYAPK